MDVATIHLVNIAFLLMMKQIKLLKDWKSKKAGDIVNISEKGALSAIDAGVGEYFDNEKECKKEIRKFLAKEHFKNATYNEEKDIIEIGSEEKKELENVINKYFDKSDLSKQIWKAQPYFYDNSKSWWLWDKQQYAWFIVDETDVLNMVSINSTANTINSKDRTEILESMKQYGRIKQPKSIKNTWVQFKDLIVDVKTGEEFKAIPEYFVTNPIPYELHKERYIETPIMDKIFKEWVGEEYIQTLYEIIAYCLIPDYPLHRIFCFIGEGMNGKSCFLNLLKKFIGKDNCCSTELDTLLSSRFEVTRLHKKLVCLMGETNFSEISKTSLLKKLSGGDLIGFEYKNKNPFEDINYSKIIIATNNLPATDDKTIGFYRRWLIIDFPNKFSEKKNILYNIPEEEYEILAVKSLILLKDLLNNREFHKEGTIEERMKRYEDHSNPMEKFIKEFTEEDCDGFIWKFDFEKRLNNWCKDNRFRLFSDTSIGMIMKKRGIENGKKMSDWLIDGSNKQLRVWFGIKWKENIQPIQPIHPTYTQNPYVKISKNSMDRLDRVAN